MTETKPQETETNDAANQQIVNDGVPEPPTVEEPADNGVVEKEEKKESFMAAATSKALRPFVIISSSYLLFTITDGAIRMIVLMHAYNKSFSALQVAIMFTLYELAGVFTNLVGEEARNHLWALCSILTKSTNVVLPLMIGCWIHGCQMGN